MDEYTKALELKVKQLEENCKYLNQQLEFNNYYRREKELNEFMSAPDFKKRIEEFIGLKDKIKELESKIACSGDDKHKLEYAKSTADWLSSRNRELIRERDGLLMQVKDLKFEVSAHKRIMVEYEKQIKELKRKADEYRRVIDELFVVEPRQKPDESEFVPPL